MGEKRDRLTRLKKKRDELRVKLQNLKVKEGFAGSDLLVKDYEARKDLKSSLVKRLQELKDLHEEITERTRKNNNDLRSMLTPFMEEEESSQQHESLSGTFI